MISPKSLAQHAAEAGRPTIRHWPGCTPDYPEKLVTEAPREECEIDMHDGTIVRQCVDCGAYVLDWK
jgi:hypothetical protein